jgi:hypothetical protein
MRSGVHWRIPVAVSSVSALLAALLIGFAGIGPNRAAAPRFDPRAALSAWRDVPLRLANLGYLGHMWELYAMWAWIGVFFSASFALRFPPTRQRSTQSSRRLRRLPRERSAPSAPGSRRSTGSHDVDDRCDGRERHLRGDHRSLFTAATQSGSSLSADLGDQHRRGFGAVLGRRWLSSPTPARVGTDAHPCRRRSASR